MRSNALAQPTEPAGRGSDAAQGSAQCTHKKGLTGRSSVRTLMHIDSAVLFSKPESTMTERFETYDVPGTACPNGLPLKIHTTNTVVAISNDIGGMLIEPRHLQGNYKRYPVTHTLAASYLRNRRISWWAVRVGAQIVAMLPAEARALGLAEVALPKD